MKEDKSGLNSVLMLGLFNKKGMNETSKEELDEMIEGALNRVSREQSFKVSKATDGRLGEFVGRRVYFSANVSGENLTGFVVALRDGDGFVTVTGMTHEKERDLLAVMMSSALTIIRDEIK
jgi:hypothetical protein